MEVFQSEVKRVEALSAEKSRCAALEREEFEKREAFALQELEATLGAQREEYSRKARAAQSDLDRLRSRRRALEKRLAALRDDAVVLSGRLLTEDGEERFVELVAAAHDEDGVDLGPALQWCDPSGALLGLVLLEGCEVGSFPDRFEVTHDAQRPYVFSSSDDARAWAERVRAEIVKAAPDERRKRAIANARHILDAR